LILVALVGVNYGHVLLHSLTGFGETTSFSESSQELLAPHNYLQTFATLLETHTRLDHLEGSGMLTSILFFIPRAIWTTKVPSEQYGTSLVQAWAGLPTSYQIAVTNVGELVVHFGTGGIALLALWGMMYRWLDDRWSQGLEWRAVLLCISVPRVFPDQGMGLSAFMISLVSVACFMIPLALTKRLLGVREYTPAASE
jgi:hypothetical protein